MRYKRFIGVLWLLLVALASWPAQVGAQDSGIKFEVAPLYGTVYRPGYWMPLRVQIANNSTDQLLEVRAGSFSTQLEVPGGGRKETIFYVFIERTARLHVSLRANNTEIGKQIIELNPTSKPLIASLLAKAPARMTDYALVALAPTALPQQTTGLDMLAAVIVDDQAWQALTPAQITVLHEWVASGGSLLVQGTTTDRLPEALRPATSGPAQQINPQSFAQLVAITEQPLAFEAVSLTPTEGSIALAPSGSATSLALRRLGEGQIVALGMPLDTPELLSWAGNLRLWDRLVPQTQNTFAGKGGPTNDSRDSHVANYLNNLPALDLPPLRMLLILLGIYILLAGPVNYVVLRRLDRMALAWVTIPVLTTIFAVLAYGFGARQRGTDIIINELAIIDDYGAQSSVVRGYVGVFSPIKNEYTLTASDQTLLRPLSFSNGWGGNQGGQTNRAIFSNVPAQVSRLSVDQWSMSMFAYQQPIAQPVAPAIDLIIEQGRVRGSIRNTSTVTLDEAALVIGDSAQKFGSLAPGEEREISFNLGNTQHHTLISMLLYQQELDEVSRGNPGQGPSRDLSRKVEAINTALAESGGVSSFAPVFLAFINQPLSTVSIVDHRATQSQTTLLVSRPTPGYGSGLISIDTRWIQFETGQQGFNNPGTCSTSRGPGLELTSDKGEVTMRLPVTAIELVPEEISFQPALDGMIDASKLNYELYNWETGAWDKATYRAGVVALAAPRPYLSAGHIRLRYSAVENIDNGGGWWGCLSPGPIVKGHLQ